MKICCPASFAGAALGAFVGLLVGLSTSPVVGGVIGAVGTIGGAIAGREATGRTEGETAPHRGLALLTGFALSAVLFTVVGIVARTHHWLAPSLATQVDRWTAVGLDETEALGLVVFHHEGLVPKGWASTDRSTPIDAGVLFAVGADAGDLDRLDPRRRPSTEVIAQWKLRRGIWKTTAEWLTAQPELKEEARQDLLDRTWRAVSRDVHGSVNGGPKVRR